MIVPTSAYTSCYIRCTQVYCTRSHSGALALNWLGLLARTALPYFLVWDRPSMELGTVMLVLVLIIEDKVLSGGVARGGSGAMESLIEPNYT